MKTSLPRFLGKAAACGAGVIVIALIFVYSGRYDVSATSGHIKPVEQILRTMMMRSVVRHARDIQPPADFKPQDRELAEHAAGHYEAMCRTCHGAPGKKPDPWQLYPAAPDLADALRVTRWSDAEVFSIIKNGIKDTGMSAFGRSHDDEEIWALTAFVRQLESMSAADYRGMIEHQPAHMDAGKVD
ncbi:MAG TPA: cytochrome c [Opitutaceae bacterium]|nr:cytochrome c [Opitutaceae bacterium]